MIRLLNKIKKKIKKLLREAWFDLAYLLFKRIPFTTGHAGEIRVLIYHGICRSEALKFNSRYLTEDRFEADLLAIKKCFHPLSFEDLKSGDLSADKLNVLLTFDDGLRNNFKYALPLLKKHQVPAVFFITTTRSGGFLFNDLLDVFSLIGPDRIQINGIGFEKKKITIYYRYVNADGILLAPYFQATNEKERQEIMQQVFGYVPEERFKPYADYLDLMQEKELRELASLEKITLGSHGVSHADLTALTAEDLNYELKRSKQQLERITGKACESFAFPYGNYNAETLSSCREQGYTCLFGTEKIHKQEDRKQVTARLTVNPFISAINQIYYIARNNYE